MKIMIATDGDNLESKMAKRFGHAAYYLIYDTETKEIDPRENFGHDDNHSSLIDLVNEGVTHFIIGNIGPNAFDVLKSRNAKIYLARLMTGKEALDKFMNNELEELEKSTLPKSIEDHQGEHHHHAGQGKGRGLGHGMGRGMGRGRGGGGRHHHG